MKALIVTVLCLAFFTCRTPTVWREYRSPDGSFSIQFPGDAQTTAKTSPLSPDVKYPVVNWTSTGLLREVTYSEIPNLRALNPDETKEYYEFLRTQTIKLNHSQLMDSAEVTLNGKLAEDFTEVRPGGKVARYRMVLLGTKLLIVKGEQDVGVTPASETSPTVDQFMSSLKIGD